MGIAVDRWSRPVAKRHFTSGKLVRPYSARERKPARAAGERVGTRESRGSRQRATTNTSLKGMDELLESSRTKALQDPHLV